MSKVHPYIILHVHLEKPWDETLNLATQQNGYYLVFWWKFIPLGDLYIEAGQSLMKDDLKNKIAKAISPAVKFYVSKLPKPPSLWDDSAGFDTPAFVNTLDSIASEYVELPLPQTVDISVIICTRNRTTALKTCLDSLQKLPCRPREIMVVDNAPSDNSTKDLVSEYTHVTYCLEPRAGLDIARNTGARQASCPIIAYADDDVLLDPLWAYHISQSFKDPGIAALTGLIIALELNTEAQQIFEKFWPFNRGYIDQLYDEKFFNATNTPPVWEIGAGANMAFRKSVLEAVGYFDERLDVGAAGCNGDSEMWYRILLGGNDILYNPRVVNYHAHRASVKDLKKQIFYYIRGHVVASLIQQKLNNKAAYNKYVFWKLPRYYLSLIRQGFPGFRGRYRTVLAEITGHLSGLLFFLKHHKQPAQKNK